MPTIEVGYCTSCNYLPRALWVASELLPYFQGELAGLHLVPGTRGVFEVRVNGAAIFSKAASGRFPDPDELRESIFMAMEQKT